MFHLEEPHLSSGVTGFGPPPPQTLFWLGFSILLNMMQQHTSKGILTLPGAAGHDISIQEEWHLLKSNIERF